MPSKTCLGEISPASLDMTIGTERAQALWFPYHKKTDAEHVGVNITFSGFVFFLVSRTYRV